MLETTLCLLKKENIPTEVIDSYNKLVALGYNKYFYSDDIVKSFKDSMIEKRISLI